MPAGSSSTTIQTCPDGSVPDANSNCLSTTNTVTTDQNAQQPQSDNNIPQPDHNHKASKNKHHKGSSGDNE